MPMQKVKVIRTIPGRHEIGETVEMEAGEARLYIRDGKVIPAGEPDPSPLDNKMITKDEVQKRGSRKRK